MNLDRQFQINKKHLINKKTDKKVNEELDNKVDKKACFEQLG